MQLNREDSWKFPMWEAKEERGPLGYLRLLEKHGLSPTERGVWAVVGRSSHVQGWKLHLSSIPVEAMRLLSLVAPLLKDYNVPFKAAKEEFILCQLNEGVLGGTQIGKFVTIYPESDVQAHDLAIHLIELTAGFQGPEILTDLRLGDIVYTRYGNFNPIIYHDRLGQVFFCIRTANGDLQVDSYSVPFVCSSEINNPFAAIQFSPPEFVADYDLATANIPDNSAKKSSKLLGPGYLLLEVVKPDAKGSVFRGIDLRSQELVSAKIIKQGRRHCLSDQYGRDIRTRLKRQEYLHTMLVNLKSIPKVDSYFEDGDHGYLPLQSIDGESIESLAIHSLGERPWHCLPLEMQQKLLSYLEQLVGAVEQIHAAGYVHRDLTASNVWIGEDDHVYILDLELCHAIHDPSPAFGTGTPGFMSPQQAAHHPPSFTDDIYALGCVMILLITGIDPRRILFAGERSCKNKLWGLTGAPLILLETIAKCVDINPTERPTLQAIDSTVKMALNSLTHSIEQAETSRFGIGTAKTLEESVQRLIRGGEKGLLEESVIDPKSGLWLSTAIRNGTHQTNNSLATAYELRRSTNRGVAGVVYLLSRLARHGYSTSAARERVSTAVNWLLSGEQPAPDSDLPGLHFGDAGVAVALTEAVVSGLVIKDSRINTFLGKALNGRLDWPDVTHGAAGQGLAALYCGDLLMDAELYDYSHRCATYLIENQSNNGSWQLPKGVDGMSGQTLTGFAHGVSGIVYFLATYAHRFNIPAATHAWQAGVQWLMSEAIETEEGNALYWSYSDTNSDRWKYWCHGSPGIALTFLRLFQQTQEPLYAEFATRALCIHPKDLRYGNLSLCHGLSGLGEIYLEASRVLANTEWFERAEKIAQVLVNLCRESETDAVSWLVEEPYQPTADLMVGSGGVIHFLLRFSLHAEGIGFPLLL